MDLMKVDEIMVRHGARPGALIEILLDIQEEYRYLPPGALARIAETMKIPISRTYHLATFFKAFSLEPKGKYCVHVCLGTACQVEGGVKILEKFERDLGIPRGGTTADMNFSLDEVHCLGCCGLAPVVVINEEVYGKVNLSKIPSVLRKYTKPKAGAEDAEA